MKKVINFVCSLAILFVLFCMAYYGLSFAVELPNIDFVNDFAIFYGIFNYFDFSTIALVLPLLAGIIFSITYFAEKNFKLVFLILEVAFLVIVLLRGFGII